MKTHSAPDGASGGSLKLANSAASEKTRLLNSGSSAGAGTAGVRTAESGGKEKPSEGPIGSQSTTTATPTDRLAALEAAQRSNPVGASGALSAGTSSVGSPSNRFDEGNETALSPAEFQRQDLLFTAAAAALEGPLRGTASSLLKEAATPTDSASARPEPPTLTDSGGLLRMRDLIGTESLLAAAVAATCPGKRAVAAEATTAEEARSNQQQQSWEVEAGRRGRPQRRAATCGNGNRGQQQQLEEETSHQQALTLKAPEGPRVVSRLPGVKYCHSRNAWIARWSEEGQERWKTFSVKACKGFTEARIQAVQFRWEKVRMKYAKLMKQATPQPGLIGAQQGGGSPSSDALEVDAEAAELAAALQMYGNGSQVRVPRNKSLSANNTPALSGRSRSPSHHPARGGGPQATEANGRPTRQKRQAAGAQAAARLAADEGDLHAAATKEPNAKKSCQGPSQQQQQQQQQQQKGKHHQQLTASQWALLQQHLQMQATRVGSSSSKPTLKDWQDEEWFRGMSRLGAPQWAAKTQQAGGFPTSVKNDPGRGGAIDDDVGGGEADLKTQLFLQVAKKLHQNSEQQDASLLQALKALLQNRQDRQEQPFTARSPQHQHQQQQLLRNDCNSNDVESELLRLVASSAGLLGAAAEDRGPLFNLQQGHLSSQVFLSALGSEELSPHSQPWGDATGEKGVTESVQTLTRLLSDEGRSSPPTDTATDGPARSGPLGLPQWPATTVLGSTRASESQSGAVTPWTQQGAPSASAVREPFDGGLTEESLDLQPWRRAVCVILEDVLENCILEVGSQQRQGSVLSQERLQFAPMVGRLKALAAKSCSKDELRPFLRLFARSIRLGLVPSKQSEDVQQLILDALGALDDALATSRAHQPPAPLARSPLNAEAASPFTVLPAGGGTFT